MKKNLLIILIVNLACCGAYAQPDVVKVDVKQRFARSHSIYAAGGPAFVQGALGDYSTGLGVEGGYLVRTNKVLSLGGSISFLGFQYDANKTYKYYYNNLVDKTAELSLRGGNVSLLSLGLNIKLNFVPVSDDSKFSFYGIATPFVTFYNRGEVLGSALQYSNNGSAVYNVYFNTDNWDKSKFPILAAESKVSGGVYLGVGIELSPAKAWSFFGQAAYGYTFPITYVSTSSFLFDKDKVYDANNRVYYKDNNTTRISYYNSKFPIVTNGFSALSLKVGIAYNF